jgi:hypothetical protein
MTLHHGYTRQPDDHEPRRLFRNIHCPICGALVEVEIANGGRWPESYVIPDHIPAKAVNLCQGARVTVTIDHWKCVDCGANCMRIDTGQCRRCWEKSPEAVRR